jgi:hypothetical protein
MFGAVRRSTLVWEHVYECSSPQRFRKFRMRVHLLNSNWLMVSNTLLVEKARCGKDPVHDSDYRNDKGLIIMCEHCCSSQRTDGTSSPPTLKSGPSAYASVMASAPSVEIISTP